MKWKGKTIVDVSETDNSIMFSLNGKTSMVRYSSKEFFLELLEIKEAIGKRKDPLDRIEHWEASDNGSLERLLASRNKGLGTFDLIQKDIDVLRIWVHKKLEILTGSEF